MPWKTVGKSGFGTKGHSYPLKIVDAAGVIMTSGNVILSQPKSSTMAGGTFRIPDSEPRALLWMPVIPPVRENTLTSQHMASPLCGGGGEIGAPVVLTRSSRLKEVSETCSQAPLVPSVEVNGALKAPPAKK